MYELKLIRKYASLIRKWVFRENLVLTSFYVAPFFLLMYEEIHFYLNPSKFMAQQWVACTLFQMDTLFHSQVLYVVFLTLHIFEESNKK